MAPVTVNGIASTFTLPNYHGSLFTITGGNNAFSGVMGGLAEGGGRLVRNYEFGINIRELPVDDQPAILEGAAIPAAQEIGMTHQKNVTQIFNRSYGLSYSKTAAEDRISDSDTYHTANEPGAISDPFADQAAIALQRIRRQYNRSVILGTYQNPTNPTAEARKMRGVLEAVDAGNVVDCSGAQVLQKHFNILLRQMWDAGAFETDGNHVIWVNAYNKQRLTSIYGYAPMDRNVGGMNIKQIETDFGIFPIALENDIPTDTILVAKMNVVIPVFQLVRDPRTGANKGVLFTEPVPQTSTNYQDHIYGELGVDHGPGHVHGKLINTAVEEDEA